MSGPGNGQAADGAARALQRQPTAGRPPAGSHRQRQPRNGTGERATPQRGPGPAAGPGPARSWRAACPPRSRSTSAAPAGGCWACWPRTGCWSSPAWCWLRSASALSVLGPWLLGHATDLIFAGVIGKRLPAGVSKAQIVAQLRREGHGTQADLLSAHARGARPGHRLRPRRPGAAAGPAGLRRLAPPPCCCRAG